MLRLTDFVSACRAGQCPFDSVQSRFYRALEVIPGLPFVPAVDVWIFACAIAELVGGRPLFAGDSEAAQLRRYIALLAPPPPALLSRARRADVFFDPDGRPRRALAKQRCPADQALQEVERDLRLPKCPRRPPFPSSAKEIRGCEEEMRRLFFSV
jgi:hypothetical protein